MGNQDYKKYDIYETEILTSSAVAYAAGDVVGSAYQLMDYDAYKPVSGVIRSAQVIDRDNQAKNMDLIFLTSSLTGATIADNGALSIPASDAPKMLDGCAVTHHISAGATGISRSGSLNIPFRLRSNGEALQVIPVAREARTHTGIAQMLLRLGIEQD